MRYLETKTMPYMCRFNIGDTPGNVLFKHNDLRITKSMDLHVIKVYVGQEYLVAMDNKYHNQDSISVLEERFVEEYNTYIVNLAEDVCTYLYLSCIKELLYAYQLKNYTNKIDTIQEKFSDESKEDSVSCGEFLHWLVSLYIANRDRDVKSSSSERISGYSFLALEKNQSTLPVKSLVKYIELGFRVLDFGGNYGGRIWAEIAACLCKYVMGEYSALLFIDQACKLQHNTSSVFNKDIIFHSSSFIQHLLDLQAAGCLGAYMSRYKEYFLKGYRKLFAKQTRDIVSFLDTYKTQSSKLLDIEYVRYTKNFLPKFNELGIVEYDSKTGKYEYV